jgi:hypothetical protein
MTSKLDEFTAAYVSTALWACTNDNGESLENCYSADDIEHESLQAMIADCAKFQAAPQWIAARQCEEWRNGDIWSIDASAGHDFFLARWCPWYGGFCENEWKAFHGKALRALTKQFCNTALQVGANGKIYAYTPW